ncbi:hypothetical protein M8C21_031430 [Ambrosia artemisiifolia]|uniref:non-specific serine/threonine protein kinase n=1 Tax=Ambrosia artemisiifolia TaxID=4212 RepID=A0AAD5GVK1_AMBAR|nr:hypothetical protein M8C21_031430 [Ambrosia artemisiifolia]
MPNGSLERFIYYRNSSSSSQLGWEKLYQIAVGIARGLEYLHRGCSTRILHFDIKPHNILLDEDFCPKISDFGLAKLFHEKESKISMSNLRGTPEQLGLHGIVCEEENMIARKMIIVGLWCIQTNPLSRPTITRVLEMLEGDLTSIEIPPKPYVSSPPRSLKNAISWVPLLLEFDMILVFFFMSVILSCLPLLHSATDENVSMPICPESFSCSGLDAFKYPFYNVSDTRCGLIKVNCTRKGGEVLFGGRSYEIVNKFHSDHKSDFLVIKNRTFEQLVTNESCEALMNDFNFPSPNPLLYSISLFSPITLYKCTKHVSYAQQAYAYFYQHSYNSFTRCKDHNFYYNYLNGIVPSDLPHTCQVVYLPVKPTIIVVSAIIVMMSVVVFIIWRLCKNNPFSYVSSKNESLNLEDISLSYGVSVFSYEELEDATQNFDPSRELGDGGFGAVYYGENYDYLLRHPNLVVLYGCTSRHSRELLLVYEYVPNGTVADHLHVEQADPYQLKWAIRMNIAIETASALVCTFTLLKSYTEIVKVADFGLSRLISKNATHVSTAPQGTPGYVDPQYHQHFQLTEQSDVNSFGVVLIELISSMVAVDLNRSQDEISLANMALNRIQRCETDQLIDPVLVSDSNAKTMNMITLVAELAFRRLQYDSDMRPTMNEVLDVLMDIQAVARIDTYNSTRDIQKVNVLPSCETNDALVLLKI